MRATWHLSLLVPLLLSTGCLVDSELASKSCNNTHPCIDGYTCVDAKCVADETLKKDGGSAPADAGPNLDSGPADAGPPVFDSGPDVDGDGGAPPVEDGGVPSMDSGPEPGLLNLAAVAENALRIRLTFDAQGTQSESLRILRRTADEVDFVEVAIRGADQTSFENTYAGGIMPDTSYVFRLEGLGDGGVLVSDETNVKTPAIAPITDGLVVAWDLDESAGAVVSDTSGVGQPLDLGLENDANNSWIPGGGLSFDANRSAASVDADATKVYNRITNSGEMTVEVWANPADLVQAGPARMVSYSISGLERNFTLAQDGADLVLRIRTPDNGLNGSAPAYVAVGAMVDDWQHLAATFNGDQVRGFSDGNRLPETLDLPSGIQGWDAAHRLVLGNEWVDDRQWLGSLHRVRVYDRPLDRMELLINMHARFKVAKLTLIDADADLPIAEYDPIQDGDVINLALLPSRNLNIDASLAPADTGSVAFYENGDFVRTQGAYPYAFADDSDVDGYLPWTPEVGVYTIKAIPYREGGANGIPGVPTEITFSVIDQ